MLRRFYEALNPCVYYLGSRANLDLERTPAVQWALRVVNDWVKDSIYTSNPRQSSMFIDIFSRAVALNFENEGDQAISYIWKARSMQFDPPTAFIQQSGIRRYNIMYSLVDFMRGREASSVQSGIMFVR